MANFLEMLRNSLGMGEAGEQNRADAWARMNQQGQRMDTASQAESGVHNPPVPSGVTDFLEGANDPAGRNILEQLSTSPVGDAYQKFSETPVVNDPGFWGAILGARTGRKTGGQLSAAPRLGRTGGMLAGGLLGGSLSSLFGGDSEQPASDRITGDELALLTRGDLTPPGTPAPMSDALDRVAGSVTDTAQPAQPNYTQQMIDTLRENGLIEDPDAGFWERGDIWERMLSGVNAGSKIAGWGNIDQEVYGEDAQRAQLMGYLQPAIMQDAGMNTQSEWDRLRSELLQGQVSNQSMINQIIMSNPTIQKLLSGLQGVAPAQDSEQSAPVRAPLNLS